MVLILLLPVIDDEDKSEQQPKRVLCNYFYSIVNVNRDQYMHLRCKSSAKCTRFSSELKDSVFIINRTKIIKFDLLCIEPKPNQQS